MKHVIVIGGGVAGLAAALPLADHGFRVTLFERRALLGGRASSFIDQETGDRIDNCQHVTMRCCTNLEDFYRRIGVADRIRYYRALRFLDGEGRVSVISGSRLPAPFHTMPSFLRFKSLRWRDKLAVARGLMRLLCARPSCKLDDTPMSDWLARSGQTPCAIDRFWRPILVSACNEEPDRIGCTYAFMIFRDGFLANPIAYNMGLPTVSLGDLYTEPAQRYIEARGGAVRYREHVDAIRVHNGAVAGVEMVDGSVQTADDYVSAVPFDQLLKMLPEEVVATPYFANLRNLEHSAITGVHLWFDRPLDAPDATAILDREMQWIFNKTGIGSSGRPIVDGARKPPRIARSLEHSITQAPADTAAEPPRTYLGLVVSSARRLADMPKEQILDLALHDVRACVPGACDANLVKWHVIKERKATFAPLPGVDRWRPAQKSPIADLFVAGDWTRTGWPATMEGAVRSGYLAAEALLAQNGIQERVLIDDLPLRGFARLLVRKRR